MTKVSPALAFARFGLGARLGDLDEVTDVWAALHDELQVENAGVLAARQLKDSAALYADVRQIQAERRQRNDAAANMAGPAKAAPDRRTTALATSLQREAQQRIRIVKQARIGFVERLVAFWTNHFAVESGANQLVKAMAGAFEREAIRPHVLGRFGDMALAATRHPAMLVYLNNAASVGPNSSQGLRNRRGLNENHARELMELHTLGVDGGYTQADVTALAKILTGWGIGANPDQPRRFGKFEFRDAAHEPGAQTVLGKNYGQDGIEQGKAVLADLATSSATATHIATKLARHFVADQPDPAFVQRLAAVFTETDGDLMALSMALIDDDAAWAAPPNKIRTPLEFIWSAIRALDLAPKPREITRILADLGQPLWDPPSPAGFKDDLASWLAPDAMTNRLDAAELMAVSAKGPEDPREFAEAILGDLLSSETATTISRAESRAQGLALMLMSPEFQRR